MTLRWFLAVCTIALLTSLCRLAAQAAPSREELGCDRPIHLAYSEFGLLYHQDVGLDVDIIKEIARRTGCQFQTTVLPRAEIWPQLENGDLDMMTSGITDDERRKFALFIPYLRLKSVLVVRSEIAASIKRFDDVISHPTWRIGIVDTLINGPYFDFRLRAIEKQNRIVIYKNQQTLLTGLINGETDVVVAPSISYPFYFPTDDLLRAFTMIDVSPVLPVPLSLTFSRKRFSLAAANAWTRLVEEMRLDGTLQRIFQDRLPPRSAQGLLPY